jgi:CRISPR-associated RAMP protein (TIGR02581 family)
MFDKLQSRLELSGWLTAETAFRIGAGRSTEVVGTDLPVVRDALGRPYIPGSSFKGVLRSRLESLVRGVCDDRKLVCNPTEKDEWCITAGRVRELKRELEEDVRKRKVAKDERDEVLTQRIIDESCLLCLTFGSPWLASKVLVRDLLVDESLWFGQFQVRNGVAIDRDTETASEGKLYDYEVVPSGACFGFHLLLENGEPWQWGMLFVGLKTFENGSLPIGGSKSRGLGWVKLDLLERKLFSLDGESGEARVEKLISFLDGGGFEEVNDQLIGTWVKAFKEKLSQAARQVKG